MAWLDIFKTWKMSGKTKEWLTARVNVLLQNGYINQTEHDEILALINL